MLTSAEVWGRILHVQSQIPEPVPVPTPPPAPEWAGTADLITQVIAPILGTGLIGALFLMIIFKIKIMPTWIYDKAVEDHVKELERRDKEHADEVGRLEAEKSELKISIKDAHSVYTEQVIPTLTRVLDAERELVELRRDEAAERRRRDHT